MIKNRLFATLGLSVLISQLAMFSIASAQSGISLSPYEQNITFKATDTQSTYNITVTNNTSTIQELDLTARDFGSLNDTGGVVLEGSNSYTQRYGLASWMTLGTDTVVLNAGESRNVPVTVENRDSLQPGGHYGAVVASVNSLNDQSGNHVVINQQLISLVLVDKLGGERYDLKLDSISQNGNWFNLPSTVRLRFQNPGNVHVIPRGLVRLLSPNGTVISQGIINSESAFVLPESYRELYVPLTPLNKPAPLPGLYHIQVLYRYDGISATAHKQFPVHFVNLADYIAIALIILIVWYVRRRTKRSPKK